MSIHSHSCFFTRKFTVDSRKVNPGDVFVAIPGAHVDGHSFVFEAQANGASLALVEKEIPGIKIPSMVVPNTVEALQNLAKERVEASTAKIIGITGTLGKTTTKEFVKTILSGRLKTASTRGNQNSQVGLALSLLNELEGDEEALVLEMGMTGPGHIKKLVSIAPPDVALITWVSLVHAEFFDSLEGIAQAKAEIFSHDRTKTGIYHHHIKHPEVIANTGACKKITYGQREKGNDPLFSCSYENGRLCFYEEGKTFVCEHPGFFADHLYDLCLAASSVARVVGLSWEDIIERIPLLSLPSKRLEVVQTKYATFINDSYNASEDASLAALNVLKNFQGRGAKVAVLGAMKELGIFSENCHRNVGKKAVECADLVCCLGKECEPLAEEVHIAGKKAIVFDEFAELVLFLQKTLLKEDVVLVKGSRSLGMWRILDHFS